MLNVACSFSQITEYGIRVHKVLSRVFSPLVTVFNLDIPGYYGSSFCRWVRPRNVKVLKLNSCCTGEGAAGIKKRTWDSDQFLLEAGRRRSW